jgi:hypothetical protein
MTNAELAALEARTIAIPAILALEASAGADNASLDAMQCRRRGDERRSHVQPRER